MTRLSLRRDPVRLLISRAPWAAAWYLFGYLFVAWALFAAAVLIVVGAGTLIGIPVVLAVGPVLVRGCANVERARLRVVGAEPVAGAYRRASGGSAVARLRARWADSALWRDMAYLFGLIVVLWPLDLGVLAIWLTFLAGITVPLWYGRVTAACMGYCPPGGAHGIAFGSFPHGPAGPGAAGLYVHTLPGALLLAGICLVAFAVFSYVLVATARLHAAVARSLLRAPGDPLREAKEVLRRPGPLTPFSPNERW